MKEMAIIFLLFYSSVSFACKERVELDEYPINEISQDEILIEAKITSVEESSESGYLEVKSFEAEVVTSYIGRLITGNIVKVVPVREAAHAVCPVYLKENGSYLLVIRKSGTDYEISRFSYKVAKESKSFEKYKEQIRNKLL